MNNRLYLALSLFLFSAVLMPDGVLASGFALPEQSAAAMGMASAFVGQADDPSAVWYNPAAITRLEGTQLSAGVVEIYPSFKHDTIYGSTESIEHKLHTTVHLYGTSKLSERLALGIGVNNPFGLSTTWSPASITSSVATLSSVKTLNINPNVAYKIGNALSVAVGVDYLLLDAILNSTKLTLEGDGEGYGANASMLYGVSDNLDFGFSYRRKIKVEVDGKINNILPAKTNLTLPDEYKIGFAIKTADVLVINVEADMTNWSTYDQIELPVIGIIDPKEWQDTWCYRLGGQYRLSDSLKLRAGYLYDTNPVREEYLDTRVPDSDRHGPTVGLGYTSGKLTVDAAYFYLRFKPRTVNNSLADFDSKTGTDYPVLNGTYRATAHLMGVTVGYAF